MSEDERLLTFMRLVRTNRWRMPPPNWNGELRRSLSQGFVTPGFGGVLKLTEAGLAALNAK